MQIHAVEYLNIARLMPDRLRHNFIEKRAFYGRMLLGGGDTVNAGVDKQPAHREQRNDDKTRTMPTITIAFLFFVVFVTFIGSSPS